jgi:hypothetical protein
MAFNSTQTSVTYFGGNTPALVRITGTYECTGGDTGGVIAPGYNNAAGFLVLLQLALELVEKVLTQLSVR